MAMSWSILVELPADAENVEILRAVTMSAIGPGASVDAVSDAGLAVDEAAALLLAVPETTSLVAGIDPAEERTAILLTGDGRPEVWPPDGFDQSLAADVLGALTGRVEFRPGPEILLEL